METRKRARKGESSAATPATPATSTRRKPKKFTGDVKLATPEGYHVTFAIDGEEYEGTVFGKHAPDTFHLGKGRNGANLENFKVIVIGAGVSGLACAQELKQNGFTVTVLEGRDRCGGRVYSEDKFGCSVDTGAGWIHGIGDQEQRGQNPMYSICQQNGLKTFVTTPDCPMYDEKVGRVDEELDFDLEKQFNEMLTEAVVVGQKDPDGIQMSLEHGLSVVKTRRKFSDLQKRLIHWHCANIEGPSAAECGELSLLYWDQDDINAFEGEHVIVMEGYGTAVATLAHELDIRYNRSVKEVSYGDNGVTVTCENGETFECNALVVTLPLGVLKKKVVTFSPELPEWKSNAISKLGFGIFNKVLLLFETVFWDAAPFFGYSSDDRGKFYLFANLEPPHKKPVLIALCAGECAKWIESVGDAEVIDSVMKCLKKMYGRKALSSPTSYTVTRWGSDAFANGSYSFIPPGSTGELYVDLARPVSDRLYFAGEHTNQYYPSTVHGAYMSGVREARRLSSTWVPPSAADDLSSPTDTSLNGRIFTPGIKRRHRGRGQRTQLTRPVLIKPVAFPYFFRQVPAAVRS